nr:MAG TPA: hypothetical protein [Caudoviricetes sp.]DAV60204.1 MAG TPA: hypothetical protein [Caudoviricetes sp.]
MLTLNSLFISYFNFSVKSISLLLLDYTISFPTILYN